MIGRFTDPRSIALSAALIAWHGAATPAWQRASTPAERQTGAAAQGAIGTGRVGILTGPFRARNFVVRAEDLALSVTEGTVFVRQSDGVTTLLVLGRGTMRFSPAPESERSQIRIMTGTPVMETAFDGAVVQARALGPHADISQLAPQPEDSRIRQRAEELLSRDASPGATSLDANDVVIDVRTGRFGLLTYLRSAAAPEDISVFSRATQQVLSVYSSAAQVAGRGALRADDDQAEYDVLHHDIDLSFTPERRFVQGVAQMRIRIRAAAVQELPIRLAASLTVRAVSMPGVDALGVGRVPGRDTMIVTLPSPLTRGTEATLTVEYSGPIEPPSAEWEMPDPNDRRTRPMSARTYLTSTFPMWYPRPPNIDYATAVLRITVPAAFDCVASGELADGFPERKGTGIQATKTFLFNAPQPIRHLAFLVTPLVQVAERSLPSGLSADPAAIPPGRAVTVTTMAQPTAVADGPAFTDTVTDIVQVFRSIIGEPAYPHLTVALIDGQVPGGHSVAYMSAVGRAPANIEPFWRTDPAAFDNFPDFVTAHEIAHQWWGQAVGWANYHDQWMSEAFAQYFAALYTERHDSTAFREVLEHMRVSATSASRAGPLSLGPRLGQIQKDDSVFRALLYNKGPAVLHTLRRLIGDEAFFRGVRQFYVTWRFGKPGTRDLRTAMETASGRSLERFFAMWIEGTDLPRLRLTSRIDRSRGGEGDLVVRVEQTGEVFDLPVSIVVRYRDRPASRHLFAIGDRVTERRFPLQGRFDRVELARDDGALLDGK